jgi:hypothetical protein
VENRLYGEPGVEMRFFKEDFAIIWRTVDGGLNWVVAWEVEKNISGNYWNEELK